VTRNKV